MDSKGLFGAMVLLLAIEFLFFLNTSSNELFEKQTGLEPEILGLEETSFRRTEAEILIDKTIEKNLNSLILPLEADIIKAKINSGIIKKLEELKFEETGICKETISKIRKEKELNIKTLGEITKVSVIQTGKVTTIEYILSGGLRTSLFPCGKITNQNSTTYFRIPVGYTKRSVVLT